MCILIAGRKSDDLFKLMRTLLLLAKMSVHLYPPRCLASLYTEQGCWRDGGQGRSNFLEQQKQVFLTNEQLKHAQVVLNGVWELPRLVWHTWWGPSFSVALGATLKASQVLMKAYFMANWKHWWWGKHWTYDAAAALFRSFLLLWW